MRFHPLFNKISLKVTKDILNFSQLVKLMPRKLLYSENETSNKVYIILAGMMVLHNKLNGG